MPTRSSSSGSSRGRMIGVLALAVFFLAVAAIASVWMMHSYLRQSAAATLPSSAGIELDGMVVNIDGQPVPEALVSWDNGDGRRKDGVRTDAAGRFVLHNLASSLNYLFATARGYAPEVQTVEMPAAAPVTLTLLPGRTIRGRVTDTRGTPLTGAIVRLNYWKYSIPYESYANIKTDSEGDYVCSDAPNATLNLWAHEWNYINITKQIPAGQTHVDFELRHWPTMTGRVTDAKTHTPVAAFTVRPGIRRNKLDTPIFEANAAVKFTNGQYREELSVFGGEIDAWFVRIDADGYVPAISPQLNDSGVQDFELQPGENLTGEVTSPSGSPVAGAYVLLIHDNESAYMQGGKFDNTNVNKVPTGATGHFQFPPPLGRFMLVAMADEGYAQIEQTADGKGHKPVDMRLAAWSKIDGRLLIGTRPGVKETIQVTLNNESSDASRPRVYHDYYTHTDADGKFTVERIPPGNVTICREIVDFHSNGKADYHQTQLQPITLAPGQMLTVNLGGIGRPVIGQMVPYPGMPAFEALQMSNTTEPRSAPQTASHGRRSFSTSIAADGKFRLEDLPAGEYEMNVSAYPINGGLLSLGGGSKSFIVPEMPGGRSDEPLDIGDVLLTKPQ